MLCSAIPCLAHGFGGSGFLHPLTGLDHFLAMIAIGVWSAQLGGKFIYKIPALFLFMMMVGGFAGMQHIQVPRVETVISFSVLFLGFAIAINKKFALPVALIAVSLFGFCHGYVHGAEIPIYLTKTEYVIGYLLTTLCLHVIGAAGGLLLTEEKKGQQYLRYFGAVTCMAGFVLLFKLI